MIQKCPKCYLFYSTVFLDRCPSCRQFIEGSLQFIEGSLNAAGVVPELIPRINEAPGGLKYDQQKPRMDLVSSIALTELAKVLEYGSRKYDAHNWRKGIVYSRLIGAALRHIFSYLSGESKDPETGLSHMAHAMCNMMFLLEFEATKPELDDRYKPEVTTISKA